MAKNHILRELTLELVELRSVLEKDSAPPRGIKTKIKRIESAIDVIKSLPPQCKTCDDKGYIKNYASKVIGCPDCNPYGERY